MGLSKFREEIAELRFNVARVDKQYDEYLNGHTEEYAEIGEARMKVNAPWNDDVDRHRDRVAGAARAGLYTEVDNKPLTNGKSRKRIKFGHGVFYGFWLEVLEHGKNQIIMPTVEAIGNEFMDSLVDSLPRVTGKRGRRR